MVGWGVTYCLLCDRKHKRLINKAEKTHNKRTTPRMPDSQHSLLHCFSTASRSRVARVARCSLLYVLLQHLPDLSLQFRPARPANQFACLHAVLP